MHLVGAVHLVRPPRAGHERNVAGQALAGRAARQELQHRRQVLVAGDDFLDPHERDVDARQRERHPAVALVLDDDERAALGAREVDAGDAHAGGAKLRAQDAPCGGRQRLGGRVPRLAQPPREEIGNIVLGQMDRRGDDVRRRLAGELDDVLAEIGLHGLDVRRCERRVEGDLFRDHRLALDDEPHAGARGDVEDDGARLGGVAGPVHHAAVGGEALLELGKQRREARDRVRFDGARAVAPRFRVGKCREDLRALVEKPQRRDVELPVQCGVARSGSGARAEVVGRRRCHGQCKVTATPARRQRRSRASGACAPSGASSRYRRKSAAAASKRSSCS